MQSQQAEEQVAGDRDSQGTLAETPQPDSCQAETPTEVSDDEDVVGEIQSKDCFFNESESSLNRNMNSSSTEQHSVEKDDLSVEAACVVLDQNAVGDRDAVVVAAAAVSANYSVASAAASAEAAVLVGN